MILDVTRSNIKFELGGKIATLSGEMFFLASGKLGFALFLSEVDCWDSPYQDDVISRDELEAIIYDIRSDFSKGGHTLQLE